MPRALLLAVSAVALALVTLSVPPARAASSEPAPPVDFGALFGGPFSLVDHDGRRRTDADFAGRFVLVYFGYTWCPDICPTSLQEIEAALDALGADGASMGALFVSLDPKRDTPAILKAYVTKFGGRITGLTGTEEEIAAMARAYRLHRVKVVPQWSQGDDDYLVDHSSLIFLLGPDGRVATLFPHRTPGETIAATVRTYMAEQR